MGEATIQGGKIGRNKYKIALLSDKYTIYLSEEENNLDEKTKTIYSAVASFDTLQEAKDYIKSLK